MGTAPAVNGRRRHLLDLDDCSRGEIESILDETGRMRDRMALQPARVPELSGKLVATVFAEASTRTRVSFEAGAKMLGADVMHQDPGTERVESLVNQGRTLQAMGVDALVVRHSASGASGLLARELERTSVVNAGDGTHAHPTQALLDLHTARERLGELQGRRLVIVGDVLHSRVARSAIWGFGRMGADVVLSGPPALMPELVPERTGGAGRDDGRVSIEPDLDRAIVGADLVMALRLQTERHQGSAVPGVREYVRRWQVNAARMSLAGPQALLMHPGPMNDMVEVDDALPYGARSLITEQVTNGIAVRMAVLRRLLGATSDGDAL